VTVDIFADDNEAGYLNKPQDTKVSKTFTLNIGYDAEGCTCSQPFNALRTSDMFLDGPIEFIYELGIEYTTTVNLSNPPTDEDKLCMTFWSWSPVNPDYVTYAWDENLW